MGVTPYIDATTATNNYFATERLVTTAWAAANSQQQTAALVEATRIIDNLNYAGYMNSPTQPHQFPRGNDTAIPQDVLDACCEIAYSLLDGVDLDLETENLTYKGQGVGEARVERDTSWAQEHVVHGVPSIRAWRLLKPYLRDDRQISIVQM